MQTFNDWLLEKNKTTTEGWMKNALVGGALLGGGIGLGKYASQKPTSPPITQSAKKTKGDVLIDKKATSPDASKFVNGPNSASKFID